MTRPAPGSLPDMRCSQESREWRRFWKIVSFSTILPFLLLLGALEWLGWTLGETYSPADLIRALDEHPDMTWSVTNGHALARLKLAQAARIRPEVLIMGQSRLEKVRTSMFAPYTFYNMTRVSSSFRSYSDLLRRLPEGYRPKLILLTVDFFMFSPGYSERWADSPVYSDDIQQNLLALHHVATQVLQHPQLLWQRRNPAGLPAAGCSAIMGGDAFFKDGSTRDVDKMLLVAGRSPEYLMQRAEMEKYIAGGSSMSQAEMADLKRFVDLTREMGIPLVAVQMPIYGPALRMVAKDPDYGILKDFQDHEAQGYFQHLGLLFFDYLTFPPYSEDYRYFDDAVHPGWPLTEAAIAAMGSDPRFHALMPRLDLAALQRSLRADSTASRHLQLIDQ